MTLGEKLKENKAKAARDATAGLKLTIERSIINGKTDTFFRVNHKEFDMIIKSTECMEYLRKFASDEGLVMQIIGPSIAPLEYGTFIFNSVEDNQ